MTAALWLILSSLLCSLQLQTGSFPKPLTAEEEREYLTRSAAGDLEARNILIERNLRLVAHIMKKYYAQTSDQEDLISIGTIGLIKAVSTFDGSKGTRLATYAARCVENAILTPTILRTSPRHPRTPNAPIGVFWIGFRRISISFVVHRIRMCGMLPYISTVSRCAPRVSCWRRSSSISGITSTGKLTMYRTGSAGFAAVRG